MKTRCPHCDVRLDFDRELAHCPRCHSSFMVMPSLTELRAIRAKLTARERGLVAHFANNPLAVLLANLELLREAGLAGEHAEAVADALEAARTLHLVVGALTTTLTAIDTDVQSE